DPKGQQLVVGYDYRDRLTSNTYSNVANPTLDFQVQSITYGYDDNSNPTSAQVVKRVGGAVVTEDCTYTYDALDRLETSTNYDNKTIAYTYDRQGNRRTVTDPDGRVTSYTYDQRNRVQTVTTDAGT